MQITHILVPTDFGDSSTRAETFAAELARRFDARLTLLHVWTIPIPGYAESFALPMDAIEEAARAELEHAAKRLVEAGVTPQTMLLTGSPWDRILAVVEDRNVDLVVMGTHGRRGPARLLLGSVAEKVVRLCPVPVLTISARSASEDEDAAARDERAESSP